MQRTFNTGRTFRALVLVTTLGAILTACAGSAAQAPVDGYGTSAEGYGETGGGGVPRGAVNPPGVDTEAGGADPDVVGAADDARIIRTGSMDLEVTDVAAAVKAARSAILAMGGYVGASNAGVNGDTPYADISYRVPADRWEDALAALRTLGGLTTSVLSEQTQAVEVTGQVVDLEARIRNLRASETALQGIAERATKISDVLEIQAQLTTVRGEIEQLTAQLKDLNDRAAFATVGVRFNAPIVAVEAAANGWDPGTALDGAAASMVSIIQNVIDAGIWFVIVWLPILLVVALFAAIAILVGRRLGPGRRGTASAGKPPVLPPTPPADLPATS